MRVLLLLGGRPRPRSRSIDDPADIILRKLSFTYNDVTKCPGRTFVRDGGLNVAIIKLHPAVECIFNGAQGYHRNRRHSARVGSRATPFQLLEASEKYR